MIDGKGSDSAVEVVELLALATLAAREAGRFLRSGPRRDAPRVAESRRDVRLEADRVAEDRIVNVLAEGPPIPIVAEERVTDGAAPPTAGLRWIVDPLDGSVNYLQGIPFCCVSVALWRDDDPLAAAVYDFDRDELFTALVGDGAWLNGTAVHVRSTPQDRAVLCTGFPVGTDFTAVALSGFVRQVREFRKIRMFGSAALSLAYVAAGRADAYFERDIRIWDVAAGLALVRAAGGEFVCAPSAVPHAWTVYAHGGACHDLEPALG